MKTAEFREEITSNGQISVPPEIAARVPPGERVAVVIMWGVSGEDLWSDAGRCRFEAVYATDDSVYEQLIHDLSSR